MLPVINNQALRQEWRQCSILDITK